MKKKGIVVVASIMMLSGTAAYAAKIPWGTIIDAVSSFIDFGGSKIPCYSSGSICDDHRYVECGSCRTVFGKPDFNSEGKCSQK